MRKTNILALIIAVMLTLVLFAACAPKIQDVTAIFENAGYTVTITDHTDLKIKNNPEVKYSFHAEKGEAESEEYQEITCICFASKADAQTFYTDQQVDYPGDDGYEIIIIGKVVYGGTSSAVDLIRE